MRSQQVYIQTPCHCLGPQTGAVGGNLEGLGCVGIHPVAGLGAHTPGFRLLHCTPLLCMSGPKAAQTDDSHLSVDGREVPYLCVSWEGRTILVQGTAGS